MTKRQPKMTRVHKKYGEKLRRISIRQKKLEDQRVKIQNEYRREIERVASEGSK